MEHVFTFGGTWLDAAPLILGSLLVKSGIVVGIAGAIAFLLRYSSASLRHLVLTSAMASLLILPLVFAAFPQWRIPLLPPSDARQATVTGDNGVYGEMRITDSHTPRLPYESETSSVSVGSEDRSFSLTVDGPARDVAGEAAIYTGNQHDAAETTSTSTSSAAAPSSSPWSFAILGLWLTGFAVALARLGLAHAGVGLLVRHSQTVENESWRFAVEHQCRLLGIERHVRIRSSRLASVPMIIGCRKPTLILPESYDRWSEDRSRLVLLHELAHIKRNDCLTQFVVEIACAVYWMNPMVWLASRQIRVEREIACDDIVLMNGTRASTYAQTILDTIRSLRREEWSPMASIAMARKVDLEGRLVTILDPDVRRSRINRATSFLTVAIMALIAIPVAIAVPVPMQISDAETPQVPETPQGYVADVEPNVSSFTVDVAPDLKFDFSFDKMSQPAILEGQNAGNQGQNTHNHVAEDVDTYAPVLDIRRNSFENTRAGYPDTLTIKQLIRLRRYGVDDEFIEGMKELGYSRLSVDELIDLSKYGADPEYVAELSYAGYRQLPVRDLVKFSKYGIDGDLLSALGTYGFDRLTADEIVDLSKYGVDEDDIADYAKAGYSGLSVSDLINLSKYGVDPDDIAEFRAAGYTNLATDDFINLSKYGVDPDDIAALGLIGYSNLTVDELIDLSKFGVDADEINELAALGYTDFSVDDLINLSKYGTDIDDIRDLNELGYTNLSADEMIRIGKYGVDVDEMYELQRAGYRFSIDEMIGLSKYGIDGEEIAELAAVGYVNLSADDLIDISRYNVDIEEIAQLSEYGMTGLTVAEIIDLGKYNVDPEIVVELRKLGHSKVSVSQLIEMAKYGIDADYLGELHEAGIEASIQEIIELGKYNVSPEFVRSMRKDNN